MKWASLICGALALTLMVCKPAQANLIVNGSFEDTQIKTNSWRWFYASDVEGWNGSNIEIWNSFQKFDAYHGVQLAELNAHPSNGQAFSIFQSFDTQVGATYDVSFAYAARKNTNEAFTFDLFSGKADTLFSTLIDDHLVRQWSLFNTTFTATDTMTTIRFTSVTPYAGTVGNFLDDIKVVESLQRIQKVTDVPEPTSILLVLIGFLIMFTRVTAKKVR